MNPNLFLLEAFNGKGDAVIRNGVVEAL